MKMIVPHDRQERQPPTAVAIAQLHFQKNKVVLAIMVDNRMPKNRVSVSSEKIYTCSGRGL